VNQNMGMAAVVEETWVTVTEGAEKTGYSLYHLRKLARDNWNKPEAERVIKLRRHSNGYLVWLPDLMRYISEYGNGPYTKVKNTGA
jgi:hypothetical protein